MAQQSFMSRRAARLTSRFLIILLLVGIGLWILTIYASTVSQEPVNEVRESEIGGDDSLGPTGPARAGNFGENDSGQDRFKPKPTFTSRSKPKISLNHDNFVLPNATLPGAPNETWIYPATYPAFYKYFAVAVKTGQDTAINRAPIQLLTFLKRLDMIVLIGEAPGVFVGGLEVKDVYTGLYRDEDNLKGESNADQNQRLGKRHWNAVSHVGLGSNIQEGTFYKNGFVGKVRTVWAELVTPILSTVYNTLLFHTIRSQPTSSPSRPSWISPHRHLLPRAPVDEAVVPDSNAQGWRLDAHKNLPGFRYLYQKYPNALWYFMIDDDTYLFIDNLVCLLEQTNPHNEHYFGAHNMFMGCDDVKSFDEGPPFAHGGSGIVLSRGALIKMLAGVDKCIVRYRDCWAGDVRTALCLRDVGIRLTGQPGFNVDPPNVRFSWPSEPCDRPHTFHHLTVAQMQRLAEMEQKALLQNRDPVVTYADVFSEFSSDLHNIPSIETDTNRPGNDFDNFFTETAQDCEKMCQTDTRSKCMAWTFETDSKWCWLKEGIPARSVKNGAVSGIIPPELPARYKCIM
jgi:hypothetical protein